LQTDEIPRSPAYRYYFDEENSISGISFTWKNNLPEVHKAIFEIYDRVIKKYKPTFHYGKMFFFENSQVIDK
jgi:hypothetical protein